MNGTAKVFRKAAEIVEERWCQGFGGGRDRCAVTSLYEASNTLSGDAARNAFREADKLLFAVVESDGFRSISEWNDAPGRTAKEVAGVLRKLAKKAGKQ